MKKILALSTLITIAFAGICYAKAAGRVNVMSPAGACDVWDQLVKSKGGGTYEVIFNQNVGNEGANCRAAGSRATIHHFAIGDIIGSKASAPAPATPVYEEPSTPAPQPIAPAPKAPEPTAPSNDDDWEDEEGGGEDDYLFDE